MSMSQAELQAAIASVSKAMERMGWTAAQTAQSIEKVARCASDYAKYTGNIVFRANNTANERAHGAAAELQRQSIKREEKKKDTMLDTEYTTVYSELKTDWDEPKTAYVNINEVQAVAQVKAAEPNPAQLKMQICLRKDNTSNWYQSNPVLMAGEVAIEYSDDGSKCYLKCGDGVRAFKDLPYITTPEPKEKIAQYAIGGLGNSIKIEF